jgi:hypothetical protein
MGPTKEMSVYHVDNPHWEHCWNLWKNVSSSKTELYCKKI